MRIVLVSDIHSNAVALDAVLAVVPQYDQLWCIGDTIGYGPQPNLCLARMRTLATHALTGNHDLACLGQSHSHSSTRLPVQLISGTMSSSSLRCGLGFRRDPLVRIYWK